MIITPLKVFGFTENSELQKIEKTFDMRCDAIGNNKCLSRMLAISACTWVIKFNNGYSAQQALFFSDKVLLSLLKRNKKNIEIIFDDEGFVKKNIKEETIYRLKSCRKDIKKAIPYIISFPHLNLLTDMNIKDLIHNYPIQYFYMLERLHK